MFSEPFAAVPVAHGLLFVPVGEHLRLVSFCLAEAVGFEPTVPIKGLLDFESRPL